MSAIKHTRAPWRLMRWNVEITSSSDFTHEIMAGDHNATVACIPVQCHASTHGEPGETIIGLAESLANARLMTAAPQMHDALQAVAIAPGFAALDEATKNAVMAAISAANGGKR